MSWDDLKKTKTSYGDIIKLKDGEFVEGVLRGEPHHFWGVFGDPTEYRMPAKGRSFRFRVNFVVKQGDGWTARLLQGGARMRDEVLSMKEEYGLDCLYKLKRTGSSQMDTKYSFLFREKLAKEILKEIGKVKLLPTGAESAEEDVPLPGEPDGLPF